MADIYLAQTAGLPGFDKLVVIKRILDEHAQAPEYRRMFLDEARVASSMAHANVVQCFDLGDADGLYLVMEYLAGQDVRAIVRAARQARRPLPWDFAVGVTAAAGLGYAHGLTGPGNRPLHLVHRDVTPSNLFVTWEGAVKVLDFGIAHVEERLAQTQAGAVKGKFRYMAPEQVRRAPLDARTDVFALGAVLFELLTGAPFISGDNELALVNAILSPERPRPSALRPELPGDLDRLVERATALEPDARFSSMETFRNELLALLRTWNTQVVSRDAGSVVRELFPEAWAAHQRLTAELPRARPEALERLLGAAPPKPGTGSTAHAPQETASLRTRSSRLPLVAATVTLTAALAFGVAKLARPPDVVTGSLELSSEPAGATVLVDGVPQQWKTPLHVAQVSLGPHVVRFTHPDARDVERQVVLTPDLKALTVRVALAPRVGTLEVVTTPRNAVVEVDGRALTGESPFKVADLSCDRAHHLTVRAAGYTEQTLEARVTDGAVEVAQVTLEPQLEAGAPPR
jgi:serine/threonine protein kinase